MMKEIHADVVKPKKNTVFYTHDYKEKRKGGANCYATAVFVHVCETKELIKKFVEMIASDYRDHSFVIDHDGIIRFTISFDDNIIFQGDHYDVEEMLQQSTYCFKELLEQRIKEIIGK